ncbi:MAG: TolC family protein, partial [Bacillota bacterium]
LKMSEVQNEQKKAEILNKIINSYYNLLMAKERVNIEKQSLLLVKEHKNIAESSYDSGVALKTDVLQAEIELSKAENRLKNAKNQYELAKKSFKNQIGINKTQEITIKDNLEFIPEINLDKEKLYKKALAEKPELKMMELNQDLTKTNLKMEEKSNYPQIMLMGNYSWQGSELDFENGSGNIVLSASMTLFDSGKSNIKEKKIEKELENIEDSRKDLKDMIELDIEQQLLKIEEQKDNIKLQEMNLNKAKESLNIEEKRFKEGMGRTVDVIQAQTTLKQIKMSKMQAENEYETALFGMLNKTGQLVDYCEEVINNEK